MAKIKWLRAIASSSLFWRFRHIYQPDWVTSYGITKNSNFINKLVTTSNVTSVLDFGCAAGADLERIKELNSDIVVYGIDINARAIQSCTSRFEKRFQDGFFFATRLRENELISFLHLHKIKKIDLVIIDRVFYCFNQRNIEDTLKIISDFAEMVFIDDFYDDGGDYIGYKHRDWDNIFRRYNYSVHTNTKTIHSDVEHANARTMVYKKTDRGY